MLLRHRLEQSSTVIVFTFAPRVVCCRPTTSPRLLAPINHGASTVTTPSAPNHTPVLLNHGGTRRARANAATKNTYIVQSGGWPLTVVIA